MLIINEFPLVFRLVIPQTQVGNPNIVSFDKFVIQFSLRFIAIVNRHINRQIFNAILPVAFFQLKDQTVYMCVHTNK